MSKALKLVLAPLAVAQALRARARTPRLPEAEGAREGECGQGAPMSLLIVGDSSAAGVGVATQELALAGRLTAQLAERCRARVAWRLVARSGVNSPAALALLDETEPWPADLAVVVLGVNDVVDRIEPADAMAARARLADRLRERHGVRHVVFAALPPVHQFPALPQPLRWLAGQEARAHDLALMRWAERRADTSYAPVAIALGPENMAPDGFHPGEPVYRACGAAIAAHIATRVWPSITPRKAS